MPEDLARVTKVNGRMEFLLGRSQSTTESDLEFVRFQVTGIQTTSCQVEHKTVRSAG